MSERPLQPGDRVILDGFGRDRGRAGVVEGLFWTNDGTLIVLLDPVDDTSEGRQRSICAQPWELRREEEGHDKP